MHGIYMTEDTDKLSLYIEHICRMYENMYEKINKYNTEYAWMGR